MKDLGENIDLFPMMKKGRTYRWVFIGFTKTLKGLDYLNLKENIYD